ncbi:type 2 lactosamine alpha-2,3-sialyltransferase isoform X3 [Pelodiscus sinensis]|uniref:type 2 lactosamine alpha-2,3-sialyltransferase isoform X3 n=1 Tax=Pelodiscus sinensis TaxID=13735 RepID=UPI000704170A|nr:type 2 lactosamine alpha-2,3-sialyltransferase isoform X3 [Pelodiscus sinensis]|eukprot:XP_025044241.1 type 2 lactosamine alpha-2,3-sialyltransferase isoform X3 [Pelodiscus sinensis]
MPITISNMRGLQVMKRILLVIFLAAAVMYVILHVNLWKTNFYAIQRHKDQDGWTIDLTRHPYTHLPLMIKHEPQTRGRQAEEQPFFLPDLNRLPHTAVERKTVLETCPVMPPFLSLLKFQKIYPFLCANDFMKVAQFYGSDKIELPYGMKRTEIYFHRSLSRVPNCGLFNEDEGMSCRRCVVVGNGGVLRNKTLGEKIDSYDVVIRMNDGPIIGYEEDVGRRTTFRLFYPESVFSDPIHYDPDTTVVLLAFKPHDLKWLCDILIGQKINTNSFWKKPALKMIYKPNQIRILDPIIVRKTAYEWLRFPTKFPRKEKPKHPTTGLIAIMLAFHICSEVHLAGFKYSFADRNSSLHYYGNETMSQMIENEYHNITAEQKFLKKLIDQNFVVSLT